NQITTNNATSSYHKYATKQQNQGYMSALYEQNQTSDIPIGGINIVYAPKVFMAVDRITLVKGKFVKQRRIIYYLDSRPGQIGYTLLLQLLNIKNGEEFSKHRFVQRIDEEFFQAEGKNISSGEINEALSRMFRKTMAHFFEIVGRKLVRKNFVVRIHKLNTQGKAQTSYNLLKSDIDEQANALVRELNKLL
ncbi:MAG: hypothetical protein ACC656_11960, partial [Candidatus Heimdallarchaeota archaeon]